PPDTQAIEALAIGRYPKVKNQMVARGGLKVVDKRQPHNSPRMQRNVACLAPFYCDHGLARIT
ncbi:MAG: hypothetical protein KDA38_08205, partial [Planctomycetales bacterium]|nr:hypothetical protein [Planctomycetales bacterium]